MRPSTTLVAGLAVTLAHGASIIKRATIDQCLVDSGVPIDTLGSEDWDRDVAPFNIRVPYTPAAIAVPTSVEHIRQAVLCGRQLGVRVSAKAGGHSYASLGFGGEDGHLMVELDRMNNVTFDAEANVATVQPGTRLGHMATVLYEDHGRAVSHGTCPGVGISGHFLHGGFGFSSHTQGLALDFAVGATVVLADGTVVEASETENEDLFWALRGAGSNFGIVASWRLRTFEAPSTLTWLNVELGWEKDTAVAGLEALEQYAKYEMPAELNFRIADSGIGRPAIEGLYYGTEQEMRAAIAPLLETAAPLANFTGTGTVSWIDAVTHYSFVDEVDQTLPSIQENFYSKSLTLKGLNGTSAQNFVDYWFDRASEVDDRSWFFQLDMHGGQGSAIARVPNDATAYAHRDKLYIIQFYDRAYVGDYPSDGFAFLDDWVATTAEPLAPSDWGMYINYVDTSLDRETSQRLYYGENLRKLQRLKAKYDPDELFYYPQSIEPIP